VVATYTQTNPDAKNLRDSIARIYAGKAGGDGRGGIGAFWRGISAYFLVAARPALSIAFFDQARPRRAQPQPRSRRRGRSCSSSSIF
jgi:hypothetical protein